MDYRDQEFRYDAEHLFELEKESIRRLSDVKQHRHKPSTRSKSRKSPKAAQPGCGMGARRNKRWTW
jgi:hypothetical protein